MIPQEAYVFLLGFFLVFGFPLFFTLCYSVFHLVFLYCLFSKDRDKEVKTLDVWGGGEDLGGNESG